jgi:uncharacterized membrane protein YgdD (TMEM256/DUF423 family)
MSPVWLRVMAAIGFVSVAMGAFGAHALKTRLDPELLAIFDTGTRYAFVHLAALLAVAWLAASKPANSEPSTSVTVAGIAFTVGVCIFTGSLWALALTGHRWLGAITPIGGLSLLVGWAALFVSTLRS